MKKKILYVHGYASSGSTGKYMQETFKDYEVFAPKIPEKFNEAIKFVENFVRENNIDLVIGTSLGGFITLNIQESVLRIAINPTFDPYKNLPEIDVPKDIYETYKGKSIFENNRNIIDAEIRTVTYGVFGGSDPLFSYYKDFQKYYLKNHTYYFPEMEHQIKKNEIDNILLPIIKSIFK